MEINISISVVQMSYYGCTYCMVCERVQEFRQSRLEMYLSGWEQSGSQTQ